MTDKAEQIDLPLSSEERARLHAVESVLSARTAEMRAALDCAT